MSQQYAKKVVQVVVYGKPVSARFPVLNQQPGRTRGSGFFVRLNPALKEKEKVPRYIITAAHVVDDAFLDGGVKVILPLHGQQEIPVQVVAIVPDIDFALLEIDPTGLEQFIDAFEIGNDHNLEFGSDTPILVLGYPLGQEQLKVLRCNFSGRQDSGIQTDCAINQGNSGGPVIYKNKIMGYITTGVDPSVAHNVSWATPINQLTAIFPLIQDAIVTRGEKTPLDTAKTKIIHIPHSGIAYHNSSVSLATEQCQGVIIQWISRYSVLYGFAKPGDKLCSVEFGGQVYKLDSRGEVAVPWYFAKLPFSQVAGEIKVGEPVTFHIWDAATETIKSKKCVLTYPNRGGFLMHVLRYEPLDYEMFGGLLVMPLRANHLKEFPQLRAQLKPTEREQDWLLVTHIVPGSEVYEMGVIEPGEVLTRINNRTVRTLDEFRTALTNPLNGKLKIETLNDVTIILDMEKALVHEKQYAAQTGTKISNIVLLKSHH